MKISISRTVLYAAGALLVVLISAALVRYHDHRQIGVTLAVTAGYSAALAVVLLTVRRERDRRAPRLACSC